MKKVFIIYSSFFDFKNNSFVLGGIQTYIKDLASLCNELSFEPVVVQHSEKEEEMFADGIHVFGTPKNLALKTKDLASENDIVIYATETLIKNNVHFKNSIAIQHGIFWDIPPKKKRTIIRRVLGKSRFAYGLIKKLKQVQRVVCVDYNFQNWFRTYSCELVNFNIIPNYSKIYPVVSKPSDVINIIFARRLCDYRGTRVFTQAIKPFLEKYGSKINVTIAGSGPDKFWMKQELIKYNNVSFVEYASNDSFLVHSKQHIAVVPTVGSEGTSLSLLEAMSSQCAVICSDVGGMTNIVLDGFNGLMVPAGDVSSLCSALQILIDDKKTRELLSKNAYNTIIDSFSYEKWKNKWSILLKTF